MVVGIRFQSILTYSLVILMFVKETPLGFDKALRSEAL